MVVCLLLEADTPPGACLGPEGSHSAAESVPGEGCLSGMTRPAEQHPPCQHKTNMSVILERLCRAAKEHQVLLGMQHSKTATQCQAIADA